MNFGNVDSDRMPFRERLRRLAETTACLPGEFYHGLARMLGQFADDADHVEANSWEELEDRITALDLAAADEIEERIRLAAEAGRADGTPADLM